MDAELIGQLVEQARGAGLQLTGEGGLSQQLTERVLEAALDGEITDHLSLSAKGLTTGEISAHLAEMSLATRRVAPAGWRASRPRRRRSAGNRGRSA